VPKRLAPIELDHHATTIANSLIANTGLSNACKISIRIRQLLAKEKIRRKSLKNAVGDVYPGI
jgi:hypothetical protein